MTDLEQDDRDLALSCNSDVSSTSSSAGLPGTILLGLRSVVPLWILQLRVIPRNVIGAGTADNAFGSLAMPIAKNRAFLNSLL